LANESSEPVRMAYLRWSGKLANIPRMLSASYFSSPFIVSTCVRVISRS